ncbi:WSC-domain-containing protein [Mollisia scopiformis]|uniref:WSC-domain-containing protein n=1 Tax=Mollisia scopiformis TaxID=149040 RepID=A0A194XFG9_MOLSC|nr:WSC-domain-containing protein [Mollisia scopiformis]KUJ18891.1 WSC-domain-containing protein [Mollisia scopiformis]
MVSSPAPSGYVYVGCYPDSVVRLLDGASVAMSNLTIAACANYCNTISSTRFYPLIGVEDKDQCFCGTNFTRDPGTANEFGCNDPCNGNANLTCGGQGYINVYNATSVPAGLNPLPVPTTTTSSVLGGITIIPVDTAPAISTTPTPSPTPIPSTKPSRALVALSISAGVLMAFLLAALDELPGEIADSEYGIYGSSLHSTPHIKLPVNWGGW